MDMNETPESPTDFLQALLAQEKLLVAPELEADRLKLLTRLAKARRRERLARGLTLGVVALAAIVFALLSAVNLNWIGHPGLWPEWLRTAAAGCMLLFPFAALALTSLYLFRHRRELHQAQALVQQAAFAEVVRQVHELKQARTTPGIASVPAETASKPQPSRL
jgi:hypothetical protein